ncbi:MULTISPECIES: polyphosphate polymerase domain-containing protein [Streptococcus]|uniref:polyphosphate polymerase domain-containing protein n=1 Tax=Streptococcus TaxID=1301 RepID=UPI0012DFC7D9|nr:MULTISPECIES: polyphosphate polymerase domain-containing protein [Streptococcus]QHF55620.1 hypothetical protein BZG42_09885 [Streptococcus sp. DAT741]
MAKRVHQKEFKRVETKYLISNHQRRQLLSDLGKHMEADDFAQSTITSLYFDTEQFDMIQDSLAKKYGKEKVRLRTYEMESDLDMPAFLEIKQKIDGVGYKYRIKTTPRQAAILMASDADKVVEDKRLASQLEKLHQRYGVIKPSMLIAYKRLSFRGKKDKSVRVTLDMNMTYAVVNQLTMIGHESFPLLPDQQLIMEVKVAEQIPDWLENILHQYKLEKNSFSKYGHAYGLYRSGSLLEEVHHA